MRESPVKEIKLESHRPMFIWCPYYLRPTGYKAKKCHEASEYRVIGQGRNCGLAMGASVGSQGMQILKASRPQEYQVKKHKSFITRLTTRSYSQARNSFSSASVNL